jgi:tetratricopeptide (TPR) repeat protein
MLHPVAITFLLFLLLFVIFFIWISWRHRYERAGMRALARKDYDTAILSFEKSLEYLGPSLVGFSNLSTGLMNANRNKEAIQVLDRAVELGLVGSTDDREPIGFAETVYLNNRGIALLNLGRYEESLDCLEKALRHIAEENPGYLIMLINYGRVYADQHQTDAAFEVLKRVNFWMETHGLPADHWGEIEEHFDKFRTAIGPLPEGFP